MGKRKLLAVFAHPDDETFLAGPLLARYASGGADVGLACATLSDSSETNAVAARRRTELEGAASVLGIGAIYALGYQDTAPTPSSPRTPRSLAAVRPEEVTHRVLQALQAFEPQVVVTDSAYGAYGHPDHMIVHRATVAAVQLFVGEQGHEPLKLYALAYPIRLVRALVWVRRLAGLDVRRLYGRDDLDLQLAVSGNYPVSARVDVRAYVGHRKAAAKWHRSQLTAAPWPLKLLEAAPVWLQQQVFGQCLLSRLHPPHEPGPPEADLFSGLP